MAELSQWIPITIHVLRCDDFELSINIYPFGVRERFEQNRDLSKETINLRSLRGSHEHTDE